MAKGKSSKAVTTTREVEFQGETYHLPIVGPGRSTSEEEKLAIAEVVCIMYATDDHALRNCLEVCGINSASTWYQWLDESAQIGTVYKAAQKKRDQIYRANLKQRARTMAERMITGFTKTLRTRELENVSSLADEPEGDPDGDNEATLRTPPGSRLITTRLVEKEVYIRPSPTLIQYALNNVDPENFERNPNGDGEFDDEVNLPPITWVE